MSGSVCEDIVQRCQLMCEDSMDGTVPWAEAWTGEGERALSAAFVSPFPDSGCNDHPPHALATVTSPSRWTRI